MANNPSGAGNSHLNEAGGKTDRFELISYNQAELMSAQINGVNGDKELAKKVYDILESRGDLRKFYGSLFSEVKSIIEKV